MIMVLNCEVPTEVSDEDFDFLSGLSFRLHDQGYLQCTAPKRFDKKYLHQFVAERKGIVLEVNQEIDHKDTNKLNNRRENIRAANKSQNHMNRKSPREDIPKGAYLDQRDGSWYAMIKVNGVSRRLGTFPDMWKAHEEWKKVAQQVHGEFFNVG